MKTLVVAEKPSVARDIARVLGAKAGGEGCISGNDYVITWALGHLVSLKEPDELDPKYKKWNMADLPILPEHIPTKVLPKTKAQYAVVKKWMNDPAIGEIICATDSGREGELIFRYIYQQAKCRKPCRRLWISSMTDAAIRAGFESLRPASEYDALYRSARCRSEADWLVGMNASRAYTLRYNALLPIGRVQTPTLNLIVQRDREIAEFVPKDYWEVRANFGDYTGLYLCPDGKETRIFDQQRAEAIRAAVSGQTGTVIEAKKEHKRQLPPQLFDLTQLQREANKLHGFSADRTLSTLQKLYETRKCVTYPRTDSRYLTNDMIPKVEKVLRALPEPYRAMAAPALEKPLTHTKRVYDESRVSDHHAIIPTGVFPKNLTPDEQKLFDMIVKRLICVHLPDYEYDASRILTRVCEHTFRATGSVPAVMGWKALYQSEKPDKPDDDEAQSLPDLQVGDTRRVHRATIRARKTQPPKPHDDASLLNLMEHAGRQIEDEALREQLRESGLGTPATRAAIIERLIQVGYVQRRGKQLISTEKGRRLISVVPVEITSAETTGKWERYLSELAKVKDPAQGEVRAQRFIGSIQRFSTFLVDSARSASPAVHFEREPVKAKRKATAKPRTAAAQRPRSATK
ncbi:MAG: DNA topoisomerase 3 [Clostridia bacterium]|nr:DNA topoisomerase 3 [Clostridia bacterium]